MIGDQVTAEAHALPPEPGIDYAEDLAAWCDGEVVWRRDDLAVVRAVWGCVD